MTEVTEYRPGTPSWVDLSTADLDAAAQFYGELFGWEASEPGPAEETGGYRMFALRRRDVAGLGPGRPGVPPLWTTYIAVADADEVAGRVERGGGQVVMPPMDVVDAGRMAIVADPEGAAFALWQARRHAGAQVVNEPGALCWNELNVRDSEAARRFYGEVFGWTFDAQDTMGVEYTTCSLGDRAIAGIIRMNEQWPEHVPAHWLPYFAVADCDATVVRAGELGANVAMAPTDSPAGRFAALADPQGAMFAVIALVSPG